RHTRSTRDWSSDVCSSDLALSGVDGLAVTKLDVLTGIDPLRVCAAYELGGRRLELPPATERAWARVVPQYEELPGWREPLGGAQIGRASCRETRWGWECAE